MLTLIIVAGLIGSAIYGGIRLTQRPATQLPDRILRRTAQPTHSPATRTAARNMQVAMIQIDDAPDFQRAASYAGQAREVPIAFRQRQYKRFRPLLVEHLTRRLNEGATCDSLMPGLVQLVSGLGIAQFEAEYIRNEAESKLTQQATQPPDFAQRMREAQTAYQSRKRTLESLPELDAEIREQLLEQAKIRLEDQLRSISGAEGAAHEP